MRKNAAGKCNCMCKQRCAARKLFVPAQPREDPVGLHATRLHPCCSDAQQLDGQFGCAPSWGQHIAAPLTDASRVKKLLWTLGVGEHRVPLALCTQLLHT